MSASVYKMQHTGNGVVLFSTGVPVGQTYRLVSMTVHFSAAPTTAEDLTMTLNANAGAVYDTVIYRVDPAAGAVTDIVYQPDEEVFLEGGDAIDVAYANTDTRLYGIQITYKAV